MIDQPQSDLIAKLVRSLLGHCTKGRWGSTQANAWVLLALDRYFRTYEAQAPDFVARAWLGDGYLGDADFKARSTDRYQLEIPVSALPADQTNVVVPKDGTGRLH